MRVIVTAYTGRTVHNRLDLTLEDEVYIKDLVQDIDSFLCEQLDEIKEEGLEDDSSTNE